MTVRSVPIDRMGLQPQAFDLPDHVLDLLVAGPFFHHDDHEKPPSSRSLACFVSGSSRPDNKKSPEIRVGLGALVFCWLCPGTTHHLRPRDRAG